MDDVTRYSQRIVMHADKRSASSERIWLRTVAVTLRDTHPHYQQRGAAGAFVEISEVLWTRVFDKP
jgi:hypothetical protein